MQKISIPLLRTQLLKIVLLSGGGQHVAMYAMPGARNSFSFLIPFTFVYVIASLPFCLSWVWLTQITLLAIGVKWVTIIVIIATDTCCSWTTIHLPIAIWVLLYTYEKESTEGWPGMPDITLLSGISGLSFDSPFLSPLLFFSSA